MAFRTWGRLPLTALGVSVLAGAGQLGIAYGFGIVRLGGAFTDGTVNRWPAQLVWVGWFAAIAAVAGAVLTERLARRDGFPGGTSEQLSVAGAAALGATVVAPLCMQPARAAELNSVDPVWAVGICAVLGAVVGAGAALAVLLRPPLGWNIAVTVGVVWLLALVSVAPSIASTGPLPTVRLGVLEPSWLDAATAQRLAMLILPTVALLAGAAIGALARRWDQPPLVGGAAGAAGPVLLAFAYLAAGPGDPADRYQLAPYYGALIAVTAGALGSTAATVLRRPAQVDDPATAAIAPSEILQPLPVDAGEPPHPAGDGSTPDATAGTVDLFGTGRDGSAVDAASPSPAHWDWPATAGSSPAPAPAGLPPARRTSAIDVLAGPPARTPSTPPAATVPVPPADPVPATPAARSAEAAPTARQEVTAGTPDTPSSPTDASAAAPAREDTPAPTTAPSTTSSDPTDVSTSKGPADDGTGTFPDGRPADSRSATTDPDVTPAQPAQPTPGTATPTGRAKRTRKPRTPAAPAAPAGTGSVAPTQANSSTTTGTAPATVPAGTAPEAAADRTPDRAAAKSGKDDPATGAPSAGPADAGGDTATRRPPRRTTARRTAAEPATPVLDPDDPAAAAGPDAPRESDPKADGTGGTPTAGTPAAPSPRPRIPIFEDATDRPGDVRPARPITPTPAWPVTPRAAGGATDDAGGRDPVEPAPRPRHRALPDLTRAASWDAFGSGRRADAAAPDGDPARAAAPDGGPARADAAAPDGDRARADVPTSRTPGDGTSTRRTDDRGAGADGTASEATHRPATEGGDEPTGGKSRLRRGLFRRNRAKGGEENAGDRTGREPEAVPAHDEEYVDWVTGLARPTQDTGPAEARTLRTGRHHRD